MTPERWRQVKDIFDAALDRSAAERATFVHDSCAGDVALRSQIERMLAADAKEGAVLDGRAAVVRAALLSTDQAESLTGRIFGHYRLEQEIRIGKSSPRSKAQSRKPDLLDPRLQ